MKQFVSPALMLVAAVALAACSGNWQPQPMHEPGTVATVKSGNGGISWMGQSNCAPSLQQLATTNAANVGRLELGMSKAEVYRSMGVPQQASAVRLNDNRLVEILYYRVGAAGCTAEADVPMQGQYLPVVIHRGQMEGYGQQYYDAMIAPNIYQATMAPVPLHPNTPVTPQPQPPMPGQGGGMSQPGYVYPYPMY